MSDEEDGSEAPAEEGAGVEKEPAEEVDMSGFGDEGQEKALYDPTPTLDAEYGAPAFWDRRYMLSEEPFA